MSEKFRELYKSNERILFKNSPILLEAYGLYKEYDDDRVICQIKFRNIGKEIIKACKIVIKEYEIDGTYLNSEILYSYLDLECECNGIFGLKVPIYLKNANTRKVEISLYNVVFDNYKVSDLKDNIPITIIDQFKLIDRYDDKRVDIIKEEINEFAEFIPVKTEEYYLCSCGAVNEINSENCINCETSKEKLFQIVNDTYIGNIIKEREEIEKKKKIEKIKKQKEIEIKKIELEKKEKEAAKIKEKEVRKNIIRMGITAIVLVIIYIIIEVISYNKTSNILDIFINNNDAIGFTSAIRGKVVNALNNKYYNRLFNDKISFYITDRLKDNVEEKYLLIQQLPYYYLENNTDCKEALVEYIEFLSNEKQYGKAISIYESYRIYLVGDIKVNGIYYEKGKEEYNKGNYLEAQSVLYKVKYDYEANQLWTEATYKYANQLKNKGKYRDAVYQFQMISDYKDSKQQYLNCKYLHVYSNKDKAFDDIMEGWLKELVSDNYPNAKLLYDELCNWVVKIAVNNNINDHITDIPNIIIGNDVVFHVNISCPNQKKEEENFYYSFGGVYNRGITLLGKASDGTKYTYGWYGNNKFKGIGPIGITIYDSKYNALATHTVNIIKLD